MAFLDTIHSWLIGPNRNSDPSNGAVAVSKSDTLDIWGDTFNAGGSKACRAIYVGASGDIKMMMADGTIVTRTNVPVGQWSWRVRRIYSTGTTASGFIADY